MTGYLKYKTRDKKIFRTKKEISVKEARQYYEKYLKNDDNILDVYMIRFEMWNYAVKKVFKRDGKDENSKR